MYKKNLKIPDSLDFLGLSNIRIFTKERLQKYVSHGKYVFLRISKPNNTRYTYVIRIFKFWVSRDGIIILEI